MSLYVCICKGDFDSLLSWPFNNKIVFTLLDQSKNVLEQRPMAYIIKPNTCKENLSFLGRPFAERNASFGAQKFVELDLLNSFDYIIEDTIFIKVEISFEN
jgi:TNF receptor-associated factor 4